MPVKTRSQTKSIKKNNSLIFLEEQEEQEEQEKQQEIEVVTLEELTKRGLTPNSQIKKCKVVINALELDFLITATNYNELKHKYALAPSGYYWKAYSEKNYYYFDWYELAPIPKKR